MTGLFSVDYNINYLGKEGWIWDNNIMLSIGTTYLSGNSFFRKADDRIEINSVLSKKVNTYWNYSAYFNFKTQLLPGYRYYKDDGEDQKEKISRILSPAIIQCGLGWYYKEDEMAWFNISPMAVRGIFVGKDYTQNLSPGKKYFGVEKGATSIISVGASFSGFFRSTLMENITILLRVKEGIVILHPGTILRMNFFFILGKSLHMSLTKEFFRDLACIMYMSL